MVGWVGDMMDKSTKIKLFHSLCAKLVNLCSAFKEFLVVSLAKTGCGDETCWRNKDDVQGGIWVLVLGGTERLCHSRSCTQERGLCSECVFQKVASVAHRD